MPLTVTLPATSAFGGSSPISASSAVVLPQPDSPTRPSRSPSFTVEPHPLHRVEPPAVRQVEPDLEVPHRQQAHGAASSARVGAVARKRQLWIDRCATRNRGLSASSIA